MLSNSRFQGLLTAGAILLASVAWPGAASAQTEQCKEEAVTMTGKARVRGQNAAMRNAITNWELEVANKFGSKWKRWTDAQDTSTKCERGKIVGITVECTITGRPCSVSISGRTEDDDGDDVRRKSDRRDDRVDDDDSKKASPYRRKWTRYEYRGYRTYGRAGSRAYWREMAYQDYLARRRDRAEKRAWAREIARQEWLEWRRDQFERQLVRGYGWYRWRWRDYD